MASYRPSKRGTKKWIARRNRDRMEYFIGYFATEKEAIAAEHEFDLDFPPYHHGRLPCHA